MHEWPGTPRFDEATEVWTYQAALDQGLYPRHIDDGEEALALTAASLRSRCWPGGTAALSTEEMERFARGIWRGLSRPLLEEAIREGLQDGTWAVWEEGTEGTEETFFIQDDLPSSTVRVGPTWVLVDPASPLAYDLEPLRPGPCSRSEAPTRPATRTRPLLPG